MRLNWKPPRVFYGWWIVGAGFLLLLYTGGAVIYSFTAIFEPIVNEFGWSYTQVSFASSIRGLESGLLAPFVGILVDRWGPRRLIIGGLVVASLGLMLLSRTTSLGMFYGAFLLVSIGMSGCLGVVPMTAVANWFRRRVGIAIGIMGSGVGFGGLLLPVIVRLIDLYQWRMTMVILALGMLVIGLPLSLLVRHKPEQYGYLPDGEVSSPVIADGNLASAHTIKMDITVKQALKSQTFWHLALAFMFLFMGIQSVTTHVMPYLSSIGITRSLSSLVASGIPLLSIGGRMTTGWFGDRFDKKGLTVGMISLGSLGLFSFAYASVVGTWLLVPFVILLGISWGGSATMIVVLLREYFGRSNFGAILGCMMGVMSLGSIVGPPLAGWVFDNWGSYQGIWFAFAGLAITGAVVMATTPPISPKTQTVDKV